jgi:hypothetical protein
MALIVLQDADEVRDFVDHAAGDGRIAVLDHLVHFAQAEGADGGALALSAADWTPDELQSEFPSRS